MAAKDKLKKLKGKMKPIGLITLSIVGSILSKMLTEKFEKQVNIQDVNITVYNCIINSLSESSILKFFEHFEEKMVSIDDTSEDLSELEAAYEFIMNNIQLKAGEGVDISFQKDEESIIISYIFNKEYSDMFYQQGLSTNESFAIAQTVAETGKALSDCLRENLGYTVPIKIKVYTNYGDLLIFINNGQLVELYGIRPAVQIDEI